jgi:hypothetical protein
MVVKIPRVIHLLCGSSHAYFIPLRLFASAIQDFKRKVTIHTVSESWAKASMRVNESARHLLRIAEHEELWQGLLNHESTIGILRHLGRHSESLCSNPRDKVYALLGISLPYHGIELEINYSISVSQVYSGIPQYIIRGSKLLDILLSCDRFRSYQYTLPSWTPDRLHYNAQGRKIMAPAVDHEDHELHPIASFSTDGRVLNARAVLLGTIKDIYHTADWFATVRDVNTFAVAGKTELFRSLNFAISSLQLAAKPNSTLSSISSDTITTTVSENTIKMFYETIVYSYHGKEESRSIWPFHKFLTFCYRLHLRSMTQTPNDDIEWSEQDTCKLLQALDHEKWLFSVTVLCPMASNTGSKNLAASSRIVTGHRPRNARIGDVTAVVRGCKQPVLLRKGGLEYELIRAIYIYEFMDEKAIEIFSQIDIELV